MKPQIHSAADFAIKRHAGQKYGDLPYAAHLADVVLMLIGAGFTEPEMEAAGWLHDVLEDTPTTLGEIDRLLGSPVAVLVHAVTSEPGRNRKERNEQTYPKIRQAGPLAVGLKLADRIANVQSCWRTRDAKLFMYHREYRDFRAALRNGDDDPRVIALWLALDGLLGWYEPVGGGR